MPDGTRKGHSVAWHLHDSKAGGRGWLASLRLGNGLEGLAEHDHDADTGEVGAQVDHVLIDPPYEEEAHTNARRTRAVVEGRASSHEYVIPFDAMTEEGRLEVGRVIRATCRGWSIVFCQIEAVDKWRHAIGLDRYRRACVWVKPDSTPQLTGDRPAQGVECFVAHWHGAGRSVWNGGGKRGVYRHLVNVRGEERVHPTQKPISLMREIVLDFTQPGDTIADCYAGSGSTGVAALAEGRRFIGWELLPDYYDAAQRRLARAKQQTRLDLEPAQPKHKQEALLL